METAPAAVRPDDDPAVLALDPPARKRIEGRRAERVAGRNRSTRDVADSESFGQRRCRPRAGHGNACTAHGPRRTLPLRERPAHPDRRHGRQLLAPPRSNRLAHGRQIQVMHDRLSCHRWVTPAVRTKAPNPRTARAYTRLASAGTWAAVCDATGCTSFSRPVSTSKMNPRTGTSFAIQGCDRTASICSRVCCSGWWNREESHGRRRGVAGRRAEPGVQLVVGERGESATGVIE